MEETNYKVQKVVGKRIHNGNVEYLLKWTGYPSSENSWEPLCNLNCEELILNFEQKRGIKILGKMQ